MKACIMLLVFGSLVGCEATRDRWSYYRDQWGRLRCSPVEMLCHPVYLEAGQEYPLKDGKRNLQFEYRDAFSPEFSIIEKYGPYTAVQGCERYGQSLLLDESGRAVWAGDWIIPARVKGKVASLYLITQLSGNSEHPPTLCRILYLSFAGPIHTCEQVGEVLYISAHDWIRDLNDDGTDELIVVESAWTGVFKRNQPHWFVNVYTPGPDDEWAVFREDSDPSQVAREAKNPYLDIATRGRLSLDESFITCHPGKIFLERENSDKREKGTGLKVLACEGQYGMKFRQIGSIRWDTKKAKWVFERAAKQ